MAEERQTQVGVAEAAEEAPAKMEFRLINPTEKGFLKHIEWNREELETAVKAKVAEYSGVAYTEETMKAAKSDRAELNNLLKAIEDRRKKVKEIINRPYAEFEAELREVTSLISGQVAAIDRQIKEFEAMEKEEKKKAIKDAYDAAVGELKEILPFERVFDQRFLNKTYRLNAAVAEVQKKIDTVKRDLETIESACGKYKLNAKDVYVRTLDLSKALAEEKRLNDLEKKMEAERIRKEREAEERRKAEEQRKADEQRKAEEERRRREEEARKAEQERLRAEQEALKAEQEAKEAEQKEAADDSIDRREFAQTAQPIQSDQRDTAAAAVDPFASRPAERKPEEKKARVKFYAIGTKEKLRGLVEYMKENGIKYGKVE